MESEGGSMTEPGKVIVPRDPSRNIDQAHVHNYRRATTTVCCANCSNRLGVPYNWCDTVTRPVLSSHTCNGHKGARP